jgi:hypothetical protein
LVIINCFNFFSEDLVLLSWLDQLMLWRVLLLIKIDGFKTCG